MDEGGGEPFQLKWVPSPLYPHPPSNPTPLKEFPTANRDHISVRQGLVHNPLLMAHDRDPVQGRVRGWNGGGRVVYDVLGVKQKSGYTPAKTTFNKKFQSG